MLSAKRHQGAPVRGLGRLARPAGIRSVGVGLASAASAALLFAGGAQAATAPVGLGSAASFSVLAGSTVTNTGPTTMSVTSAWIPGRRSRVRRTHSAPRTSMTASRSAPRTL